MTPVEELYKEFCTIDNHGYTDCTNCDCKCCGAAIKLSAEVHDCGVRMSHGNDCSCGCH